MSCSLIWHYRVLCANELDLYTSLQLLHGIGALSHDIKNVPSPNSRAPTHVSFSPYPNSHCFSFFYRTITLSIPRFCINFADFFRVILIIYFITHYHYYDCWCACYIFHKHIIVIFFLLNSLFDHLIYLFIIPLHLRVNYSHNCKHWFTMLQPLKFSSRTIIKNGESCVSIITQNAPNSHALMPLTKVGAQTSLN